MFGAAFTVPATGVLLNDQMDDFAADVQGSNAYGLTGSLANRHRSRQTSFILHEPSFVEGPDELPHLVARRQPYSQHECIGHARAFGR